MSAKRDRPSHFGNDEDDVDGKVVDSQKSEAVQKVNGETEQRKIFKIKHVGSNSEAVSSQPKFSFFSTENKQPDQQQKSENKQPAQSTEAPIKEGQTQLKKQINKDGQSQTKPKSIFSSSGNPPSNIFGNGSIFGNSGTNGIGLFTNNGPSALGNKSLFSNKTQQSDKDNKITTTPSSSIFSGPSIFNFNNNGIPPVKKEGAQQTGSLFNSNAKPEDNGGDDDGDSVELQKEQNVEIDKSKSSGKYEYVQNSTVLFQGKATKVKKQSGDVIQNVQVKVSKDNKEETSWVNIVLPATKHNIVTGFIIKGKCQAKKLGQKDENVVVSLGIFKNKLPQKQVFKIQFEDAETGKKFLSAFESLLQ